MPISFSWDIHYACNYRCPYCWWHGRWPELSRNNRYLSVEEWMRHWRKIYDKYGPVYIDILGGEPFIYPNFKELIKELCRIHKIFIFTNLSTEIHDFAGEIDSDRVKLSPTFHPVHADLDTFLKKMKILRENNFCSHVLYLAYPPQIKMLEHYRERFNQENINLGVITFWGTYNGVEYPQGYTEKERLIINGRLASRAGEKFQLSPKDDLKGKLCRAGQHYAVIQADGKVARCGGSELNEFIGHFFDDNFKLLDNPLPCKAKFCKCNEWASLIIKDDLEQEDNKGSICMAADLQKDNRQYQDSTGAEDKQILENFLRNKEKNIQETAMRRLILESHPLRLGVIVTDWCNLRCIMCPPQRHKANSTLPVSALEKITGLLPYLERIDWQGGEFFKIIYLKEMFSSFKKYPQIKHEITTNGLLLDEEWITMLLDLDVTVTFSIDSPLKKTYEYIRRGGKFKELIKCLNLIMSLENRYKKSLKRHIAVVVMKSNCRHLDAFVAFAKEYGFQSINFNPVMYIDTEENIFKDPHYDYRFLAGVKDSLEREFSGLGINFVWNLPVPDTSNDNEGSRSSCSGNDKGKLPCNLPWKSLWISADRGGEVTPDCWCVSPVGNIFQNSLSEIWNNEKMQQYRRKIEARDFSLCNKDCVSGYSASVNKKIF